jgi:Ca-activated chloride channel homolog
MNYMRIFILFCFGLLSIVSNAQVTAEPTKVQYGEMEKGSDRVIDVLLKNSGPKDTYMLRSEFDPEYSILFSSRTIQPDSTVTLRIKYNPRKLGTHKDKVPIYFTTMQEPLMMQINAQVNYVDPSNNTACPSFRNRPSECCADWLLTINVRNAETGKPIPGAQVRVVEQGVVQAKAKTDSRGQIEGEVPIGYYLLLASAEEFLPTDSAMYVNRRNNLVDLYLQPKITSTQPEDPFEEGVLAVVEEEETTEPEKIETGTIDILETTEEPLLAPIGAETEMPTTLYAKNNVVFLIDVSQSMAQKGKLELLKASMLRLVEALRDVDQVAIVTYASQANVVLDVSHATDKTEMIRVIQSLEAGGMTAGAKGFKGAYAMNLKSYLEDGNNQVIVATDGAFRKADHTKIVKKFRHKQVRTTVIGIRSTTYASKVLKDIAESGDGSYLALDDFDEGQELLLEEIKKQSFIGR